MERGNIFVFSITWMHYWLLLEHDTLKSIKSYRKYNSWGKLFIFLPFILFGNFTNLNFYNLFYELISKFILDL